MYAEDIPRYTPEEIAENIKKFKATLTPEELKALDEPPFWEKPGYREECLKRERLKAIKEGIRNACLFFGAIIVLSFILPPSCYMSQSDDLQDIPEYTHG